MRWKSSWLQTFFQYHSMPGDNRGTDFILNRCHSTVMTTKKLKQSRTLEILFSQIPLKKILENSSYQPRDVWLVKSLWALILNSNRTKIKIGIWVTERNINITCHNKVEIIQQQKNWVKEKRMKVELLGFLPSII